VVQVVLSWSVVVRRRTFSIPLLPFLMQLEDLEIKKQNEISLLKLITQYFVEVQNFIEGMASNLKNKFEELARPKDPTMEEVEVGTGKWKHSGHSGGGHTGHDGKYKQEVKIEARKKPPPPKKSLADLP
jgi:hypothetical protein